MPNLKLGHKDYLWAAAFNGTDDLIRTVSFIKRAGEAGAGRWEWAGERRTEGRRIRERLASSAFGANDGFCFALCFGKPVRRDSNPRKHGPIMMGTHLHALYFSFISSPFRNSAASGFTPSSAQPLKSMHVVG